MNNSDCVALVERNVYNAYMVSHSFTDILIRASWKFLVNVSSALCFFLRKHTRTPRHGKVIASCPSYISWKTRFSFSFFLWFLFCGEIWCLLDWKDRDLVLVIPFSSFLLFISHELRHCILLATVELFLCLKNGVYTESSTNTTAIIDENNETLNRSCKNYQRTANKWDTRQYVDGRSD